MYGVEVSKVVGLSWLFVALISVGSVGCSRDRSLPRSDGFQANLEGINEISRPMHAILQKILGGFLSLCL